MRPSLLLLLCAGFLGVGQDLSEERALIQHSLEILTKVSGQRPCGWLSSTIATTDNTADLLAEQKLLWHGDYNYLDQPCRVPTRHGKIVAIPHSDYADNRVLRGSPRDFLQRACSRKCSGLRGRHAPLRAPWHPAASRSGY